MSAKKKVRQYSVNYLSMGFIESPQDERLPMCLLCMKTFSNEAMKPSRLQEHLNSKHPDKKDKCVEFFKNLHESFKKRSTIHTVLNKTKSKAMDGLVASYKIAELIAKNRKSHNVGEKLIIPALREVISTVMHQDPNEVLKVLPISDTSVQRRIDEMASDVKQQLMRKLQSRKFSLQVDESTLIDNSSLLLGYVRFFDDDFSLIEELMFSEKLISDTKGESVFILVKSVFFNNGIPLQNLVACASDGAPSMVGRYKGFMSFMKKEVPGIFVIHCVIHRQHLVAKHLSPQLHASLNIIIKTVNNIKSHAKNERIFKQLCETNDEQYVRLLLHTEVRWLSKGNCLARFVELFDTILDFFGKLDDFSVCNALTNVKKDLFYMSGIYRKMNEMNLQLQGKKLTLIDAKQIIGSFIEKLNIFYQNVSRKEFYNFPELAVLSNELLPEDIDVYATHLKMLQEDMTNRFQDIINLNVEMWMLNPFETAATDVQVDLQEEIVELRNDEISKMNFNKGGITHMWLQQNVHIKYPKLWSRMELLFLAFPSTYMVETGFSAVTSLMNKQRNRLDVASRGDLRLALTSLKPDIFNIVKVHEAQGSH